MKTGVIGNFVFTKHDIKFEDLDSQDIEIKIKDQQMDSEEEVRCEGSSAFVTMGQEVDKNMGLAILQKLDEISRRLENVEKSQKMIVDHLKLCSYEVSIENRSEIDENNVRVNVLPDLDISTIELPPDNNSKIIYETHINDDFLTDLQPDAASVENQKSNGVELRKKKKFNDSDSEAEDDRLWHPNQKKRKYSHVHKRSLSNLDKNITALLALIPEPAEPIGLRAKLEKKNLDSNSQQIENFSPSSECFSSRNRSSTASTFVTKESDPSSPVDKILYQTYNFCQSNLRLDLKKLLMTDIKSQSIIRKYAISKMLYNGDRKLIVEKIIEHSLLQTFILKSFDFLFLAQKIVELFPTECVDTYYIPCGVGQARQSSGKLVCKYRNVRKTLIKSDVIPKMKKLEENASISEEEVKEFSDDSVIKAAQWLKIHSEPCNEVLLHWKKTAAYRKQTFKKHSDAATYLAMWPALKQHFGHKLINIDFCEMYPSKKDCLYESWGDASFKIMNHIKHTYPSDSSIQLLLESISANTGDIRDLMIFRLIPTLCKPSIVLIGKKRWHPTVADSQDSFLLHVKDQADLQNKLDTMQSKMMKIGDTMKPFVICVGPSNNISAVLVYNDKIFYKVESVIEAVDSCFKLFQVLNLKYPAACGDTWNFIQRGLYKIAKLDGKLSSVLTLINDLKL